MIPLTIERAKELKIGDVVYYMANTHIQKWWVNGKVQTWKRDLFRIKIPIKFGLYKYDYITNINVHFFKQIRKL